MGVQINGSEGNVIATKGTYSGNVTIGGTLTYEDVTNIDSVGLVTARTGIEIGARPGVAASISVDGNMIVSGISTFNGDVKLDGGNLVLGDSGGSNDDRIKLGAGGDLQFYHVAATANYIQASGGHANIHISNLHQLKNQDNDEMMLTATSGGAVDLYYNNSKKIETTNTGATVTGNLVFGDDGEVRLGDSGDLQLFHHSSSGEGRIYNSNAAGINIITDLINIKNNANNETLFKATNGGAVELYYNNTKHFETQTNGIKIDSGGDTILEMHTSNSTAHSRIQFSNDSGDNYGGVWYGANNTLEFRTNNAERMRIDLSGRLLIGAANNIVSGSSSKVQVHYSKTGEFGIFVRPSDNNTGGGQPMLFQNEAGTSIGSISANASNVAYNTSSDYRLKENDVSIIDGITRLKKLRPIKFNWKTDTEKTVDGFLAHEVSSSVPEAVIGEKDAVNEDGSIKPQQLDYSKLVPLLTAALKEAITKIETLEAEVAALKSN